MYELYTFFTPHTWAAMLGGCFGGLKVFVKSRSHSSERWVQPLIEDVVDFFISIIIAVSVTSYYFDPNTVSPFIYLGAGVFIGYAGTYALELFQILFPRLIKDQVKKRFGVEITIDDTLRRKDTEL